VAASGSVDASVRLWDIQSGACLHKLTGHDATVVSVAMAPTSGHVISVATDDRLCIWETVTGNLLHCLQLVSRRQSSTDWFVQQELVE
jgi:WD40 repeat protein